MPAPRLHRAGLPRRPGLPVPHRMSADLDDLGARLHAANPAFQTRRLSVPRAPAANDNAVWPIVATAAGHAIVQVAMQ